MTMRALVCEEFGSPEQLRFRDMPVPEPVHGEVRITVRAVAANFPDLLLIGGKYQLKPQLPFSPGIEVAGIVDAVGPGVKDYAPGQRVMARIDHGGFAEKVCAPVPQVEHMPDDMSFVDGAGFLVAYGTSYHALIERGNLRVGEVVLVLGATGGVGLTAVELAHLSGAIVIAAGGDDAKLEVAREYGADFTLNYRREDIRDRVKELTDGEGADVIYDAIGGDATDQAVRALAWGGRLLVVGFAAGRIPQIPANRMLLKNAASVGVIWGPYTERNPDGAKQSYARLLRLYRHGKLKPKVSRILPFDEAASAIAALSDRSVVGRTVVTIGD
jgi:NADPH:quinone reductase